MDKDSHLIYETYLEEARGGKWDSSSGHVVEDMIYSIEMAQAMSFEDWYKRVIMGGNFRDLIDLGSLVNLYAGNAQRSRGQLGPSGAPNRTVGPWQAAQDFVHKLTRHLNPLGLNPSKGRKRVYETPEFAEKYNKAEYDEYDRLYREAWKKMLHARKADDDAGVLKWEMERNRYQELRSNSEFQKARSEAYGEESAGVDKLQLALITMDNWNNLAPEAQQEIIAAYKEIGSSFMSQN